MKKFFYLLFLLVAFNNPAKAQCLVNPSTCGGNFLNLNGGYATAGNAGSYNGLTALTVQAWVYPTAYPDSNGNNNVITIVGKGDYSVNNSSFAIYLQRSGNALPMLRAQVYPAGNNTTFSADLANAYSALPLNKWTHVALIWQSGGRVDVFINGVFQNGSASFVGSLQSSSSNFYIGTSDFPTEKRFKGYIDEVSIFNARLSDGNWQGAYTGGDYRSVITSSHPYYNNLMSYYRFQESSGTSSVDEGCDHNNLTLNGSAGFLASAIPCSQNPPTPTLTVNNSYLDKVVLQWQYPSDFPISEPATNSHLAFQVYKNYILFTTIIPSSSDSTYSYTDLSGTCSAPYQVWAQWVPGNGSTISNFLGNTITGSIKNIHLSATNGTYVNKTVLTWDDMSTAAANGIEVLRDGQQIATLSSPSATQYTDFDGTPGVRYAYTVRPIGAGTIPSCAQNVDTGWIKENGRLSGYVRSPLNAAVPGVTVTATGTISGQTYTYTDTTDVSGYYEINNVFYNTQATYTLKPSKGTHQFTPDSLQRSLDVLDYNAPQADFTDTSVFTVSGHITFPNQSGNAGCAVVGAKILINGSDQNITTDNTGYWTFTATQEGNYTFTPVYKNHSFDYSSRTYFITDNTSGVDFSDIATDTLYLSLFGHCTTQVCDYSTIQVEGVTSGGCYHQTFTVPGNSDTAVVLPAQEYLVTLNGVTYSANANIATQILNNVNGYQFVDLSQRDTSVQTVVSDIEPTITGGDTIILPDSSIAVTPFDTIHNYDTTTAVITPAHRVDYLYGGTLAIEVLGLDSADACGNVVVSQGNIYQVRINVKRVYAYNSFTSYCPLDTGLLAIYDNVSDSNFVYYPIDSGIVRYNINPGQPNISPSGAHPYGKFIQFTAGNSNEYGLTSVSSTLWMTELGNRALTPTFITKTPELPFFVLHDPPGDGSSATLSQGTTLSYGYETDVETSVGSNNYVNVQVGSEVPVPFTGIVFSATGSLNASVSTNLDNTSNNSVNTSFTMLNSYSTSDADDFVGEDADVVVGASLNLIYGVSYIVNYDTAHCSAKLDTALTWGANDFATTYAYTIGHIKNTLIPQFQFLKSYYENSADTLVRDSALIYQNYINVWNQVVDQNHTNIVNSDFEENRSFSAGVAFTNETTYDNISGFSIQYQTSIDPTVAAALHIGTEDNFVEVGTEVNLGWTTTTNTSSSIDNTKDVSYTLTDDDPGDFFSVDIRRDKVYGTPAFKTVAGTSSCPHEDGTQSRDLPAITVLNPYQTNVPVTSQAVFTVQMDNFSESNETRTYDVIVDPNTNLDGAIITLGGQLISQFPASFTIPANQSIFATLSVEKGPVAVNYNNISLIIYSPCDQNVSATAQFSVGFQSNCSPISLYTPSDNWLINNQSGDTLIVTYGGFNANDTSLSEIGLQIHRPGLAWTTIPASIVSKLQLQQNNYPYYAVALNMSGLVDGPYEIRAYAICNTQPPITSYSVTLSGTIAHSSIALFGTPSPSDGVLNYGEDISVTFNAPLDCNRFFNQQNLVYDSVTLRRTDNGQRISSQYACNGQEIIITTNPASLIDSLQNVQLTARVKNIYDSNGNILASPIEWSFVVNRSKQFWDPSSLSFSLDQNASQNVTAALKNDGGSAASFTITKVPSWMSTTTANGTVPSGNFNNISFTVTANLNPGVYNDTVIADFGGGNQQFLFVRLEVHYPSPYWTVNPSQYQYSMNIIANFSITSANAPLSKDVNDKIAVFSGNQIRGVGNIQYVQVGDVWEAFITVYSNSVSGDPLRFRFWDASEGKEYEAVETATFVNNAVLGQQLSPMILHPAGVVQRIPVAAGWNWFSLNVTSSDMSVNNMLRYLVPDSALVVKTDDSYSQYSSSLHSWQGSLPNFGYQKSYMIFIDHADTLQFVGNHLTDTVTIPFATGWNWVGYPQTTVQNVNAYMQTFAASNGDVLKSQTQFTTFNSTGNTWNGSLIQLNPGEGYKLQTSNVGTVQVYPNRSAPSWNVNPYDYEYNMNITAVLRVNGADSYGGYLIGAFINNACVGVSEIQNAGGLARIFLTLHGNAAFNNQPLEFRVYEYATDSTYAPTYAFVNYVADGQNGSVENPFVLSFSSPWSSVAYINESGYALYQNVPNPFSEQTVIRFVIPKTENVTLEVYDYTGKLIRTLADEQFVSGEHTVQFDQNELSSGIYFYRMKAGEFVQTKRMVVSGF